jgi:hypothetical protein
MSRCCCTKYVARIAWYAEPTWMRTLALDDAREY